MGPVPERRRFALYVRKETGTEEELEAFNMAAFGLGGFGGGGPGGFGSLGAALGALRPGFEEQYHCYPVSFQVRCLSAVIALHRVANETGGLVYLLRTSHSTEHVQVPIISFMFCLSIYVR